MYIYDNRSKPLSKAIKRWRPTMKCVATEFQNTVVLKTLGFGRKTEEKRKSKRKPKIQSVQNLQPRKKSRKTIGSVNGSSVQNAGPGRETEEKRRGQRK